MAGDPTSIDVSATLAWYHLTAHDIEAMVALTQECGGEMWGPLSPGDVLWHARVAPTSDLPHYDIFDYLHADTIEAIQEASLIRAAQREAEAMATRAYSKAFGVELHLQGWDVIHQSPLTSRSECLEAIGCHRLALGYAPPVHAGGWQVSE